MATTVKIDNVELTHLPSRVRTVEPQPSVTPTAGHGKIIYIPQTPGQVEMEWGPDIASYAALAELRARRGGVPQHVLSWTKESGTGLYHRNVVMPPVTYSQQFEAAIDSFTMVFEEYLPIPGLVMFWFWVPGVIAVGDGQAKIEAPAGGRLLVVDGYIGSIGTGVGQTRVQLSSGATDYLGTPGDFVVASGTGLMENEVLVSLPTFDRGDVLELDVDGIPGNSDSANLQVSAYALMFPA